MRERRSRGATVVEGVRTRCTARARAFDLVLTMLVLPFALALAALVAIAVVLDSQGPVLFRSARVGRDGRLFRMVKFRTMRHLAGGASVSSQDDRRYTPVGRLLAVSRLDELPQLWNVLRGQMRLVGPRPEIESFVLDQADSYRRILSVPPGITGPTQLEFADEGRLLAAAEDPERFYRSELLPQKVRSDLEYVKESSRIGDTALLLRTWTVPFTQLGSSLAGSAPRSRTRLAPLLARAGALAGAAMTMVALFAVEGASAQGAAPPASDPGATSPAGSVYALPLDAARRDAAPRGRASQRGRGGRPGSRRRPGAALTQPGAASPIRSENHFGSSSKVPGVDAPAAGSGLNARAGRRDGEAKPGRDREAKPGWFAGANPEIVRTAFATPTSEEADESGPSAPLTLLLVGLLLVVGVAAGTLSGRARRR